MTVSYQYEVASSTSGGFTRLLFMWKGSLYKLIYRELLLFLLAFGILSALYRNLFTVDQKRLFEKVVVYCDTFINLIPLSFVLGFYVAYVAARWWNQYLAIPWPDKLMHSIALYVHGNDDHARMTRRTLMRYLNLTLILVLRSISSAVKRRFPKLDHLVEAGFMTPTELQMFQSVPSVEFNTYWIPCTWFINILKETRRSNRIADPMGLHIIMEEFNEYRSQCGMLWSYDWVSIPLVYTQVVTIATYSFFLAALVGRQYVDEDRKTFQMEVDIYLPVFTILQFFFYMGLLKVAEQLINPFGDDDEDFELNWLIDRHTKVSYLGVDTLMTRCPPLVKDMYYNDVDLTLPYTEAAVAYKRKTYRGSVHNMVGSVVTSEQLNSRELRSWWSEVRSFKMSSILRVFLEVPEEQHAMFLPEIEEEDEEESMGGTRSSKTSILSLHHVGTPSPGHSPAEGIWRRNSDKSKKGPPVVGGRTRTSSGSTERTATLGAAASSGGASAPPRGSLSAESDPPDTPVMPRKNVLRTESFHSWKSFFSSLAGFREQQHNSSTSSVANSEASLPYSDAEEGTGAPSPSNSRRSSSTSTEERPSTPPPSQRPRLQSCPKLLVLVGRNDSMGSTGGRKKGVRWKPVLDDACQSSSRRGSSTEDAISLCRGCQERLSTPGRYGRKSSIKSSLRGQQSVPDLSAVDHIQPSKMTRSKRTGRPLGSAPELSDYLVRDDTYWRGGKFPGTSLGLTYGQRSSRGILKKMMFWRGLGGSGRAAFSPGDSVVVQVEPSNIVTQSLPDIAGARSSLPRPSLSIIPSQIPETPFESVPSPTPSLTQSISQPSLLRTGEKSPKSLTLRRPTLHRKKVPYSAPKENNNFTNGESSELMVQPQNGQQSPKDSTNSSSKKRLPEFLGNTSPLSQNTQSSLTCSLPLLPIQQPKPRSLIQQSSFPLPSSQKSSLPVRFVHHSLPFSKRPSTPPVETKSSQIFKQTKPPPSPQSTPPVLTPPVQFRTAQPNLTSSTSRSHCLTERTPSTESEQQNNIPHYLVYPSSFPSQSTEQSSASYSQNSILSPFHQQEHQVSSTTTTTTTTLNSQSPQVEDQASTSSQHRTADLLSLHRLSLSPSDETNADVTSSSRTDFPDTDFPDTGQC